MRSLRFSEFAYDDDNNDVTMGIELQDSPDLFAGWGSTISLWSAENIESVAVQSYIQANLSQFLRGRIGPASVRARHQVASGCRITFENQTRFG